MKIESISLVYGLKELSNNMSLEDAEKLFQFDEDILFIREHMTDGLWEKGVIKEEDFQNKELFLSYNEILLNMSKYKINKI